MTTFTYTATDPNGVDLSLFFPGTLATKWFSAGTGGTTGSVQFQVIENGTLDLSGLYRIETTGKDYSFPSGDGGLAGTITSANLSFIPTGSSSAVPLATLAIALGTNMASIGGVPIPSMMDMAPNTILRFAARFDPDGAKLILNGGDGNDTLPGSQYADTLDGRRGVDRLVGSGGDDLYFVDNGLDTVVEGTGEGTDTVIATVSFRLAEGTSVEILRAFGTAGSVALTGNAFNNQLFGNVSSNRLDGSAGNDTLTGDAGRDVFAFTTKLDKLHNVDQITDFNVADDSIWLENGIFKALGKSGSVAHPAKLKSAAFHVGSRAHDGSDHIIYNKTTGDLYYDPDGNGRSAQIKFAHLTNGLNLKASDFFVI